MLVCFLTAHVLMFNANIFKSFELRLCDTHMSPAVTAKSREIVDWQIIYHVGTISLVSLIFQVLPVIQVLVKTVVPALSPSSVIGVCVLQGGRVQIAKPVSQPKTMLCYQFQYKPALNPSKCCKPNILLCCTPLSTPHHAYCSRDGSLSMRFSTPFSSSGLTRKVKTPSLCS